VGKLVLGKESGGIAETRFLSRCIYLFDKCSGDALADIREDGFSVRLLAVEKAESHSNLRSLAFTEIED
jgi:hypothetical protein